jgi:o-succinylbenzoate synthase
MRIEPFNLALEPPLSTAAGPIAHRQGFVVAVEHAGHEGIGEATPLPGWTESRNACREALERADVVATELDWGIALARMDAPAARHGLSLALADARAKAADQPLYRTLGAEYTVRQVPVNATIGDGTVAETREAAQAAVDHDFGCLKVKVGARDLETDVERLRAVREVVGDRIELRADANGAWDRETAREALTAFDALEVAYVEQPLGAEDLAGLADLRASESAVGVAVDETLIETDLADIVAADAADVAICKPMVLGGPDRAADVARRARDAGIEPVVSTTIDAVVARTGAVHVAATIPEVRCCGLATADRLVADLGRDPAPVEDGAVAVPQDKGLGLADRPAT